MIEIKHQGDQIVLLNIPPALTQEEAQDLAHRLSGVLDSDYSYHLGHVPKPLPYAQFKVKKSRLDKLLGHEPKDPRTDPWLKEISALCRELGY